MHDNETFTFVRVPRHEYALLIAAKAKWDMVEKLAGQMSAGELKTIIELFIRKPTIEEGRQWESRS